MVCLWSLMNQMFDRACFLHNMCPYNASTACLLHEINNNARGECPDDENTLLWVRLSVSSRNCNDFEFLITVCLCHCRVKVR